MYVTKRMKTYAQKLQFTVDNTSHNTVMLLYFLQHRQHCFDKAEFNTKSDIHSKNGGMYKIERTDCNKSYVGHTKKKLHNRLH